MSAPEETREEEKQSDVVMIEGNNGNTAAAPKAEEEEEPETTASSPMDNVQRMTESQARQCEVLEAKALNDEQKIRILNLEIDQIQRQLDQNRLNAEKMINQKIQERGTVEIERDKKKAQYLSIINQIATTYNIKPEDLIIDTDTRIVRDGSGLTGTPSAPKPTT